MQHTTRERDSAEKGNDCDRACRTENPSPNTNRATLYLLEEFEDYDLYGC
jgi:hypothetical protein